MRVVICFFLLLSCTGPSSADPRWWTNDRQVTLGANPKNRPQVTALEGNGGYGVFVAWEGTSGGNTDIYLAATFDGCNWCGPVLWATGSTDETHPWIGAGTTHSLEIAIQVLFVRDDQIYVASDFSIPFIPDPVSLCRQFAALATPTPRLLSQDPLATDSHPRIYVVGRWPVFSHFHAVWQSVNGAALPALHYDLTASESLELPELVSSVSVWPMSTSESAAYLFWVDQPGLPSPSEVVARAGVLDSANLTKPRDLDLYPLGPSRVSPPDPTVSMVHPLSNCAWGDGWPAMDDGQCAPLVRASGSGASHVSSRDISGFEVSGFFTVFLDDRTGTPQVFW